MRRVIRLILILIAISFIFFVFFFFEPKATERILEIKEKLEDFARLYPFLSRILFFFFYLFTVVIFLPIGMPLQLIAGFLFGTLQGVLLVVASSSFGALIAFSILRIGFYDKVEYSIAERYPLLRQNFKTYGAFYLFAARMMSIPFHVVNAVMAVLPIKAHIFFTVTVLGLTPICTLNVYLGSLFTDISSVEQIFSGRVLALFALIGVAPLFIKLIIGKAFDHSR